MTRKKGSVKGARAPINGCVSKRYRGKRRSIQQSGNDADRDVYIGRNRSEALR